MKMKQLISFSFMVLCAASAAFTVGSEETPTISVAIASFDSDSFDHSKTNEELDQYVFDKLGFHVQVKYLDYLSYGDEMSNFMLQNEFPDVCLVIDEDDYNILQNEGYFLPLNNLLDEYGMNMREYLSEQDILSRTEEDGLCYAIPCIHSRGWTVGFEYRTDIAKAYGLDMESVHSIEDLNAIFADLKEKNPSITPLGWNTFCTWDILSDSLGVLMNMGHSDQVENLYETEEYKNICLTLADWREKGYLIDTDYVQQDFSSYVSLTDVFGKLADYNPAMQWTDSVEGEEEFCCIPLTENVMMSNSYQRNFWVIAADTKAPECAMQFLNLLYSDPVIPNLFAYGTLGKDYELSESGNQIKLHSMSVEGADKPIKIRNYLVGNQYLCYLPEGFPENLWEQTRDYDGDASFSEGYGFTFDNSSVVEQVHACEQVVSVYDPILMYGTSDALEILVQFQKKLKVAGIDDIIAEKQRQFDAWKAGADS